MGQLAICQQERDAYRDERDVLEAKLAVLEGTACLICGKSEPCELDKDTGEPSWPGSPCTFDSSPIDAAKRFLQRAESAEAKEKTLREALDKVTEYAGGALEIAANDLEALDAGVEVITECGDKAPWAQARSAIDAIFTAARATLQGNSDSNKRQPSGG